MVQKDEGLRCPECRGETGVIDTRKSGLWRRRRRICETCGYRFSTMEIPAEVFEWMEAKLKIVDAFARLINEQKEESDDDDCDAV